MEIPLGHLDGPVSYVPPFSSGHDPGDQVPVGLLAHPGAYFSLCPLLTPLVLSP